MQNQMKQVNVSLNNGTVGELEVSETFITKLLAAGYSSEDLSDGKKLLEIICRFALNAESQEIS
jgi:hypothetical protein